MFNETETLLLQAKEALETKEYAKAEALQSRACDLMRGQQADESRLATGIEQLADIHCIQEKFDLCAREYQEVVQMREKLLPENDFNILRPLYAANQQTTCFRARPDRRNSGRFGRA
jgi:hypothetical protein